MTVDLSQRVHLPELMDDPSIKPRDLFATLRSIRAVNRFLNGTRSSLHHLARLTAGMPVERPVTVLDVGTGSGDIPVAMTRWGRRNGRDVRVVAVDWHATTLRDAARFTAGEPIALLRADALRLPLADRSVDIVHCGMFLHHFRDHEIVAMLRDFDRVARVGVILNDLLRCRAAYWGICLLTVLAPRVFRHDARLSVRRGFVRREAESLARSAGLAYVSYTRHAGYRFCLAGAK